MACLLFTKMLMIRELGVTAAWERPPPPIREFLGAEVVLADNLGEQLSDSLPPPLSPQSPGPAPKGPRSTALNSVLPVSCCLTQPFKKFTPGSSHGGSPGAVSQTQSQRLLTTLRHLQVPHTALNAALPFSW